MSAHLSGLRVRCLGLWGARVWGWGTVPFCVLATSVSLYMKAVLRASLRPTVTVRCWLIAAQSVKKRFYVKRF